jgi:hypothetical protein
VVLVVVEEAGALDRLKVGGHGEAGGNDLQGGGGGHMAQISVEKDVDVALEISPLQAPQLSSLTLIIRFF